MRVSEGDDVIQFTAGHKAANNGRGPSGIQRPLQGRRIPTGAVPLHLVHPDAAIGRRAAAALAVAPFQGMTSGPCDGMRLFRPAQAAIVYPPLA